jgi:pimeloyl-ACP methyl ester carboxylesterase
MLMRSDGMTAARILQCYLDSDQPPMRLHEITVPTLVIHGTADRIRPPELGIAMAEAIPGATLVMIDGAGHVPTVTHPNEVVTAILERFGD